MLKISSLFRCVSLSLVTLLLAVACTQQPKTTTTGTASPASAPLVSATNSWVGYAGHYVAVEKGFFAQEGLNIQDKLFATSSEEITALLAGKLDIAWLTSGDTIHPARLAGPPVCTACTWIIMRWCSCRRSAVRQFYRK